MRNLRGGPGDFERRLARAVAIAPSQATAEPLAFQAAALAYQRGRAETSAVRSAAARVAADVVTNRLTQRYPLLDLGQSVAPVIAELEPAVGELHDRVPAPLGDAGRSLVRESDSRRRELVEAWLDDPSLLDARVSVWIRLAAAPVLEQAAGRAEPPSKEEWAGGACPMCGDSPQCSAIVEESGAFLQGSPRYLICARCAGWWGFSRAKCAYCGEDDSRRITPFVADDRPWARVDACDSCHGYIKTFDLRAKGAADVVPLVDDVATLALDVWAHENGFDRPVFSLAGV